MSAATELGRYLLKMAPRMQHTKATISETIDGTPTIGRHRVYIFPSLDECRARWVEEFGPTDWPADVPDEPPIPQNGF